MYSEKYWLTDSLTFHWVRARFTSRDPTKRCPLCFMASWTHRIGYILLGAHGTSHWCEQPANLSVCTIMIWISHSQHPFHSDRFRSRVSSSCLNKQYSGVEKAICSHEFAVWNGSATLNAIQATLACNVPKFKSYCTLMHGGNVPLYPFIWRWIEARSKTNVLSCLFIEVIALLVDIRPQGRDPLCFSDEW
jgi:hypothetical protein